jgi:hypothetical protein
VNYKEAMTGAEKAGTIRRSKRRILYHRIVMSIGGVLLIAGLIWLPEGPLQTYKAARAKERTEAVHSAAQSSQGAPTIAVPAKVVLRMAPGGSTGKVPVPPRMRVEAQGDDFRWHMVYEDGHEVAFLYNEARPADGNQTMPFVYFENVRKDAQGNDVPNAIVYRYVPQ